MLPRYDQYIDTEGISITLVAAQKKPKRKGWVGLLARLFSPLSFNSFVHTKEFPQNNNLVLSFCPNSKYMKVS